MSDDPFFAFDSYHLILAMIGAVIIFASWLPRFFSKDEPAAAPLMLILGAGFGLLLPEFRFLPDPREQICHPKLSDEIKNKTVGKNIKSCICILRPDVFDPLCRAWVPGLAWAAGTVARCSRG